MTLAQLKPGQTAVVTGILSQDEATLRMAELGLIEGTEVRMIRKAPLGDPLAIQVLDYELCLRHAEARGIEIQPLEKKTGA